MTGRPTKYKEEYCDLIIEHCKDGSSIKSFANRIDVHVDTVYEWAKVHPNFSDSIKVARQKCEEWWEKAGREGMFMGGKDNPFQASIWIFNMKARFGWRDVQQVETKGTQDINISYSEDA